MTDELECNPLQKKGCFHMTLDLSTIGDYVCRNCKKRFDVK